MFGHPFRNADLALDHAALKRDIALVAVGDDFFDTVSGASRQNMTENGNKRHEHQAFLAPAVPTCKADASRGDGRAFRRCVDQRLCARGLGSISPHHANEFLDVVAFIPPPVEWGGSLSATPKRLLATMQHPKLLSCQIGATPHLDSVRYRG